MIVSTPILGPGGLPLFYGGQQVVLDWRLVPAEVPQAFSAAEYAASLFALLPTGPAFPRERGAGWAEVLTGLASELSRVQARAVGLFNETNPGQAVELLGDWERALGLPDAGAELATTLAQRQQLAAAKLTGRGGQTPAFFVGVARLLGYSATVQEFRSATQAQLAGVPYVGTSWAHTWRLNVQGGTVVRAFAAGAGGAGEPLRSWGDEAFERRMRALIPAHTTCLFAYS